MNRNLIEDTESSGGFLSGFLDLGRGAADIYRTVTQPATSPAPTSPTQRVTTPLGNFSPLAIGGAVLALVLVLWLALRGK